MGRGRDRRRRNHDSGSEEWSDGYGSDSVGRFLSSDEEVGVVGRRRRRDSGGGGGGGGGGSSLHYGHGEPPRRSGGGGGGGGGGSRGDGGDVGVAAPSGRSNKRTRSPPPSGSAPPTRYERADYNGHGQGSGDGGGGREGQHEPPGTSGRSSRTERSRARRSSRRGRDDRAAAAAGGVAFGLGGLSLGGLSTSLRTAGGLVHNRVSSLLSRETPGVFDEARGTGRRGGGGGRPSAVASGGRRRSSRGGGGSSKHPCTPPSVLGRLHGALPVTGQGWGLLLLSVLLLFYIVDFFAILDAPSMAPLTPAAGAPAAAGAVGAPPPVRMVPLREDADDAAPADAAAAPPAAPAVAPPPVTAGVVGASSPDGASSMDSSTAAAEGTATGVTSPAEAVAAAPAAAVAAPTGEGAAADGGAPGAAPAALGGAPAAAPDAAGAAAGTVGADGRLLHPFNRNMDDLQVPAGTGKLDKDAVAGYYRKLAQAYLAPFANGIFRQLFFDVLRRKTYSLTPPGANKGIQSMLLQIIDGKVYLLDPYEVPKNAKPFYRARINEIIWLLSRLATAGRIRNTEFLIAIHDCVQTVNKEHTYRGAHFTESNPVFTIVSCNFSDNIPFPMWEGNADRGGGFESWDAYVKEYAADSTPWADKVSKAVFRGGNRPSMYFKDKADADTQCDAVGRTRLRYLAETEPTFFDVSIGGTCGGKHTALSRLTPQEQHHFKYILYAEGNCFWADRMNMQVFGPSAVIKQETPCGQFWEPLLRPFTHYIPTDFFFRDTSAQVAWATTHDAEVQAVVAAANAFAWNFLTLAGIETYAEVLLDEYTKLLVDPTIKLETGAIDVTNQKV